MQRRMGEAVARVARRVNEAVEAREDALELNLEGNLLHRLPEELGSLLHLRAINLARNKFRRFPEPLAAAPALESIDLEGNEIAEVPVEVLASMASLRSLNLRANPVCPDMRLLVRPLVPFELLLSPEGDVPEA
ncbi:leucine-rich repeat-containing protein 20-like isoform X3 [Oxyura jamaicensis]|uniref:leucine-rich repeat-containing protein 20-like isoform X3 n=1 Tax=Oxyura jamaicensis TaxID=8884 RepID=UPI0015A5B0D4|nr:leucine-rich repeat-containing protein 20-like isoform X3 [Oxyura jamaicensis]XP_035167787.1 leucine-rich repeat-containing protein 20-like isoform X3 [Oxyura jamaicensis]